MINLDGFSEKSSITGEFFQKKAFCGILVHSLGFIARLFSLRLIPEFHDSRGYADRNRVVGQVVKHQRTRSYDAVPAHVGQHDGTLGRRAQKLDGTDQSERVGFSSR